MKRTDPGGMAGDPEEWSPRHHASAESFSEDREGLLLPTPTGKQCRFLMFRGGLAVHVEESKEEIQRLIGHLRESSAHFLELTDPQFGESIELSASAVDDLLWIGDLWIDMSAARDQQKQREIANRMNALGVQAARPNRAERRL